MKSQALLTVWCNISGGAGGEIWHWSLSGVKGLRSIIICLELLPVKSCALIGWFAGRYFPVMPVCSIMGKCPAKQANVAVLKAPHRKKNKQTSTTDEYRGNEQEFYYPEAESIKVNKTFKKRFTSLHNEQNSCSTTAKKTISDQLNNFFPPSTKGK